MMPIPMLIPPSCPRRRHRNRRGGGVEGVAGVSAEPTDSSIDTDTGLGMWTTVVQPTAEQVAEQARRDRKKRPKQFSVDEAKSTPTLPF